MTPVLTADEMRAVDSWAIQEQGVPSLELMENAGRAVAEAAAGLGRSGRAVVVCGKGNNGGDGLVAARALAEMGFESDALLLAQPSDLSGDAQRNLERFPNARTIEPPEIAGALDRAGVVVDAIFGTGFAGAPRDPAASAINAINASPTPVVATDVAKAAQSLRRMDLVKPPGLAESIDWTAALATLGARELDRDLAARTLGAAVKYREDQDRVLAAVADGGLG